MGDACSPIVERDPVDAAGAARRRRRCFASFDAGCHRTAGGSFGPWTTAGGTAVTVAQGESASVLASRYGVPMEALIKANGLTSASQVTPGTSLVVPVYNAAARQASSSLPTAGVATAGVATAAVAAAAVAKGSSATKNVSGAARTASAATRTVTEPAKTAASTATAAARTQAARVAEPARKVEQKVDQKAAAAADASKQRAAEAAKTTKKEVAKVEPAKPREAAAAKPAAKPAAEPQQTAAAPAAAAAAPVAEKPEFRWPARGRIIQGFKSGSNDGIAIAVPEGTSVKAAEGGVVAYAGNELKGYGNLVLIRHPNGFVSAYAHNGEINVKRGETVKRGQTIAKSGQTGNVSAPQLHFELRKGSTPVDPTQYLAGI